MNAEHQQDAKFQQLVVTYQQAVLTANQQVEDALVQFFQSQEQAKLLELSVAGYQEAVTAALQQLQTGTIDINRYATIAQNLVATQS